ncbi:MAG: hypothetical protein AB7I09_20635, partial [Planctomycetota bacterium]
GYNTKTCVETNESNFDRDGLSVRLGRTRLGPLGSSHDVDFEYDPNSNRLATGGQMFRSTDRGVPLGRNAF